MDLTTFFFPGLLINKLIIYFCKNLGGTQSVLSNVMNGKGLLTSTEQALMGLHIYGCSTKAVIVSLTVLPSFQCGEKVPYISKMGWRLSHSLHHSEGFKPEGTSSAHRQIRCFCHSSPFHRRASQGRSVVLGTSICSLVGAFVCYQWSVLQSQLGPEYG
jgi:hypothetical protein